MTQEVLLLPGDGIGPEVTVQLLELDWLIDTNGFTMKLWWAVRRLKRPVSSPEALEAARQADAILLGAAGGPQWDALPMAQRPEKLLGLRLNWICSRICVRHSVS